MRCATLNDPVYFELNLQMSLLDNKTLIIDGGQPDRLICYKDSVSCSAPHSFASSGSLIFWKAVGRCVFCREEGCLIPQYSFKVRMEYQWWNDIEKYAQIWSRVGNLPHDIVHYCSRAAVYVQHSIWPLVSGWYPDDKFRVWLSFYRKSSRHLMWTECLGWRRFLEVIHKAWIFDEPKMLAFP